MLKNVNSDLNEFFIRILEDLTTYESWEELKLDYDPYIIQKISIDDGNPISIDDLPDFSLKQLLDFLQALVNNYDKEFIEPIVQLVTDNAPGSNKIKYRPVEILIDNLYSK